MQKKSLEIDVLRIIMAIHVCLFHASINTVTQCDFGYLNSFIKMGAVAMTGFFILSGYCLFKKYKNIDLSQKSCLKQFYIRRFISIYPLYLFVVLIYKIFIDTSTVFERILLAPIDILGIQSVFCSLFQYSHISGTWFISCMVICYIVYPLIQIIINKFFKNDGYLMYIFGGGMYIILIYAPIICHFFKTASIYTNPFFRLLEFALGISVAKIQDGEIEKKHLKLSNYIKCGITLLFFIFYVLIVKFMFEMGIACGNYMFYSIATIPFVVSYLILNGEISYVCNKGIGKVISKISEITYSFYLGNILCGKLIMFISSKYKFGNLENIILVILIDVFMAIVLHYFIEEPIKRKIHI